MNVPRARSNVPATQLTKPALKAALAATFGERPKTAASATNARTAAAYPRARMNVRQDKKNVPPIPHIAYAENTILTVVMNGRRTKNAQQVIIAKTVPA